MSWQDISTAPKQGRIIIGGFEKGIIFKCGKNTGTVEQHYTWIVDIASRSVKNSDVFLVKGFNRDKKRTERRPTHWMPLPEPPVEGGAR